MTFMWRLAAWVFVVGFLHAQAVSDCAACHDPKPQAAQADSAAPAKARAAPARGRGLFLANCGFCHGGGGEGGRGPNLKTAKSVHGRDPASLKKVITEGVAGTQMPSFSDFSASEMADLVSFVASLSSQQGVQEEARGDAARGAQLYESNHCSLCHRLAGQGSVYGPDLTRVGAGRPLAYLRQSLVDPSADIAADYDGVVVTTRDGVRITGVRINEDTFSVQLRDLGQKFRMFDKREVRSVADAKTSMMPPYHLAEKDLDDLVAYLASLRGTEAGETKKAEGIR